MRSSRPLCFSCQRGLRRGHWASLFSLRAGSGVAEFRLRPLIRRPASACRRGWSRSLRQALGASDGPRKEKRDQAWARMPRPISSYYVTRVAGMKVKDKEDFWAAVIPKWELPIRFYSKRLADTSKRRPLRRLRCNQISPKGAICVSRGREPAVGCPSIS